jgi:hypothetical protein
MQILMKPNDIMVSTGTIFVIQIKGAIPDNDCALLVVKGHLTDEKSQGKSSYRGRIFEEPGFLMLLHLNKKASDYSDAYLIIPCK